MLNLTTINTLVTLQGELPFVENEDEYPELGKLFDAIDQFEEETTLDDIRKAYFNLLEKHPAIFSTKEASVCTKLVESL